MGGRGIVPVFFIITKEFLSSSECFCFSSMAYLLLVFDPGKICEFSRLNILALMAGQPNMRNGMSLRPKGFGFTVKGCMTARHFLQYFLRTSAAKPLVHI